MSSRRSSSIIRTATSPRRGRSKEEVSSPAKPVNSHSDVPERPPVIYDQIKEKYESDILNIRKIIPNTFTLLGTVIGLSAVRFALLGQWEYAVCATIIAAFVDGLDGPTARALRGESQFGAELDSLNDFVCFGVAPALLLYLWRLHELNWIGWLIALSFTLSMQGRLARFNAGVDYNTKPWTRNYFMGVPAPAGAGLALTPLSLSFLKLGPIGVFDPENAVHLSAWLVFVSLLCISRLPTFSSKMIKRSLFKGMVRKATAAVPCLLFAYGLFFHTSLTMALTTAVYLVSIPICSLTFHIEERKMKKLIAAGMVVPAPVSTTH